MRMPVVGEALAALGVGLLAVSTLSAQRPAAAPFAQTGTALCDVSSVTQSSTRLKQQLEALKKDYEGNAAGFKKDSERGNQLTEKLRGLPPESPDYKKLEQELLKMRADFELRGKRVTNDVRERESKLYFTSSRELQDELTKFAKANNVQLILRYDPTPQEFNDPRTILQEIQKPIVYQRGSEVTPAIVEAMNRRTPGAAAATGRAPAATKPVQR